MYGLLLYRGIDWLRVLRPPHACSGTLLGGQGLDLRLLVGTDAGLVC